jgi:asparagine synthase (glutamine-hydrolysing)
MCGIWTYINLLKKNKDLAKLFSDYWNIKPRGPDNSYLENYGDVWVGFHRLAIMDTSFKSNQPFVFQEKERTVVFTCNGEIYNFRELIDKFDLPITTNSDCMTIPQLYLKYTREGNIQKFYDLFDETIKGEFAFVLLEFDRLKNLKYVITGRDQIGRRPMYYHKYDETSSELIFTSEIKGTNSFDGKIEEFPIGTIMHYDIDEFSKITQSKYQFRYVFSMISDESSLAKVYDQDILDSFEHNYLVSVKRAVINSVKRRLDSDRPLAFLLSGGVDSSLVASIAAKLLQGQKIRTFCCGMTEGTDLYYARKVAKHIGSDHTEVFFTIEEALSSIRDVIWATETWDTTTIRASVGQYLVSKHIGTKTDAKVVFVGEGPDEICSSYLFNWYAPEDGEALHETAVDYVRDIHMYDGRRSDRCISHWGLEGRYSLLDEEFIKAYWEIPARWRVPKYKGIEKWWLRKAFDGTGLLPDDVLFRIKEAMSDGLSSKEKSFFKYIQEYIEPMITDEELLTASEKYPHCTPQTKEALYYRKIFCELFGEKRQDVLPRYWQPKWTADGKEVTSYVDPSARTLSVYDTK